MLWVEKWWDSLRENQPFSSFPALKIAGWLLGTTRQERKPPTSLFWAYATNWNANSPPCSISPAVCEQHQLLSLSWMTGFFFRETSSASSLRSGHRLQWCSGRQGCLLQELSEVDLQKVCLHNSPSLYAVRAFLYLCLLTPLDSK